MEPLHCHVFTSDSEKPEGLADRNYLRKSEATSPPLLAATA